MSDGVAFTDVAAERIGRATRRVELMAPGTFTPTNNGQPFAAPTGVIRCEVKVTGDSTTTCRPIYPGTVQQWNGCGFDTTDDVWVFELNDQSLTKDATYLGKVIDSNFRTDSKDSATERTLVQVWKQPGESTVCNACTYSVPSTIFITITGLGGGCTHYNGLTNKSYESTWNPVSIQDKISGIALPWPGWTADGGVDLSGTLFSGGGGAFSTGPKSGLSAGGTIYIFLAAAFVCPSLSNFVLIWLQGFWFDTSSNTYGAYPGTSGVFASSGHLGISCAPLVLPTGLTMNPDPGACGTVDLTT